MSLFLSLYKNYRKKTKKMVAAEIAQVTVLEFEKFGEKSELGSFTRHLRQEIGIKINHAEALEMIQAYRGVNVYILEPYFKSKMIR